MRPNTLVATALIVTTVCAVLIQTPVCAEDGFVQIFDGKTLDGWEVMGDNPPVSVVDGAIHVHATNWPHQGWVGYTKAKYKDFVLKFEGRYMTQGANSGIFFRATDGQWTQWVNPGYEVNHRDNKGVSEQNLELYGPRSKEDMMGKFALDQTWAVDTRPAVNEWATFVITVQGSRINVDYNGHADCLTSTELAYLAEGYVGFQAEGGVFEYRNVFVKPLEATAASAPVNDGTLVGTVADSKVPPAPSRPDASPRKQSSYRSANRPVGWVSRTVQCYSDDEATKGSIASGMKGLSLGADGARILCEVVR